MNSQLLLKLLAGISEKRWVMITQTNILIIFRIISIYTEVVFYVKVTSIKSVSFPGIEPSFFAKPEEKYKSCYLCKTDQI